MGKILGGGGGSKAKPAAPYAGAQFQPYSYTSSLLGSTSGTPSGNYGFNVTSDPNPSITSLGQTAIGYSEPYLQQYLSTTGQDVPMFSYGDTGEQRAADIFGQQSALLEPKFAQQRQQLSSDLFGSGRLGLQLSGETVGAGDVGMVNPDAYGLGLAQSQALSQLSAQARAQAMAEQNQGFTQAAQQYGLNREAQNQQLANYLAGFQGSLGAFGTASQLEQGLVNQGLSIEQARSQAQQASASGGAALAQAGTQATSGGGGLFGSLLQGAATAFGTAVGGPLGGAVGNKVGGMFNKD